MFATNENKLHKALLGVFQNGIDKGLIIQRGENDLRTHVYTVFRVASNYAQQEQRTELDAIATKWGLSLRLEWLPAHVGTMRQLGKGNLISPNLKDNRRLMRANLVLQKRKPDLKTVPQVAPPAQTDPQTGPQSEKNA